MASMAFWGCQYQTAAKVTGPFLEPSQEESLHVVPGIPTSTCLARELWLGSPAHQSQIFEQYPSLRLVNHLQICLSLSFAHGHGPLGSLADPTNLRKKRFLNVTELKGVMDHL